MGSLLSMVRAEANWFKLTKSNCTCQGKKLFSRNTFPEKILFENLPGGVYLGHNGIKSDLIAGTDVAYPRKTGKMNFMRKTLCPKGYLLCSRKTSNMKPNSGGMNI